MSASGQLRGFIELKQLQARRTGLLDYDRQFASDEGAGPF
jgi:hypothetical protein